MINDPKALTTLEMMNTTGFLKIMVVTLTPLIIAVMLFIIYKLIKR